MNRQPDGPRTGRRLSRRAFLGRAAAAAALASVAGPLAACQPPEESGAPGGGTNLDFVIWSYSVETVQSNIDKFQQRYPKVSVNLSDFSWNSYHETMVNRFNSETPMDVAYDGGNWLPYYADTQSFLYNEKILNENGISEPPQTWEELTEQAKMLQQKGMESPVIIEMAQDLPTITEAFTSMVFGRGGEMFDEEANPLWTDPASPRAG